VSRRQEREVAMTSPAETSSAPQKAVATSPLASEQGRTSIADSVVQKIAGVAAHEVPGVYDLGGGTSRAFGAMRERIPGSGGPSVTRGVAVEVGEKEAAVDLQVVVDYGVSIVDLAQGLRRNVINKIERMTGLSVVEVNIDVDDVHLPGDEEPRSEQQQPRVQ
jgi:uncharacterized alkaline shock family protein YloU